MSFIVRKATVNDAHEVYEMIKTFHNEVNIYESTFLLSQESFIDDCFNDNSKLHIRIATFNDLTIGYSAYTLSYNIFKGDFFTIKEIFVKKEYRKIGVSIFLFSDLLDIANQLNVHLIDWEIDISDKINIEIEKKADVILKQNLLIIKIDNLKAQKVLSKNNNIKNSFIIDFVKSYELPDVFNCMLDYATEFNLTLATDIYKLMCDGYSLNPKFKIIVAKKDNEIVGFLSFYISYSTQLGKTLTGDQIFIKKKYRNNKVATKLLFYFFKFMITNNFEKIDAVISKYEVEKIERLKEFGVFPYMNLRIANFDKEAYSKLFSNDK